MWESTFSRVLKRMQRDTTKTGRGSADVAVHVPLSIPLTTLPRCEYQYWIPVEQQHSILDRPLSFSTPDPFGEGSRDKAKVDDPGEGKPVGRQSGSTTRRPIPSIRVLLSRQRQWRGPLVRGSGGMDSLHFELSSLENTNS